MAWAFDAGVSGIVHVGSGADPAVFEEAVALAAREPRIRAAIGCHPHEADQASEATYEALIRLASRPEVVAIGEIGLDYHYDFASRDGQRRAFERQLAIAADADLPVVIHCREAHEDCLAILGAARLSSRPGVIHCYTADIETARRYVALGFLISIPGVVTFPGAGPLIDTVREMPVDRMLIETDSPYLAPVPKRGRPNEPAFIRYTAEAVARIKGLEPADVARVTELNARRLFGLAVEDAMASRLVYPIRDALYINMTNRCTLRCTFCRKFQDWVVKGHNLRLPEDPPVSAIRAALEAEGVERYAEVVFCGYGEPLRRLDAVIELARWLKERGKKVRINTDGLASRVHGRDVPGELAGLVDAVSVSLNAPDAATYARFCLSSYGESAYEDVCAFLRRAREVIPDVTATVVGLPGLDVEACRRKAEDELGVRFRLRPYDDLG
jgi:TatD DNase family protein